MKLKTFSTHTLATIKTAQAIESEFNVWAHDKNIKIIRANYYINKRINEHDIRYEELSLFLFYEEMDEIAYKKLTTELPHYEDIQKEPLMPDPSQANQPPSVDLRNPIKKGGDL